MNSLGHGHSVVLENMDVRVRLGAAGSRLGDGGGWSDHGSVLDDMNGEIRIEIQVFEVLRER
jgi:hypothetical protein